MALIVKQDQFTQIPVIITYMLEGGGVRLAGGVPCWGIARWKGLKWDPFGGGVENYGGAGTPNNVLALMRYNNLLYVGGAFNKAGNVLVKGLCTWNGYQWDSLTSGLDRVQVVHLKNINGELYAGGTFNIAGGIISHHIARWNGINWFGFNFGIDSTFGGVFAVEQYNGDLYVGGNILPANIRDLFVWDGTSVSHVGQGIVGSLSNIASMVVYNNELYVGGYFTIADGNAGNFIMRWNGSSWNDVGGGMDHQITELEVHGGLLYACGVFDHAGGITASKIAVWDGSSWSALGPDSFDNNLNGMEFFHNELYVIGGFVKVNSDTLNYIAKYTGQLGTEDFARLHLNFFLSPNPSTSFLSITLSSAILQDAILASTDPTGREQFRIFIPRQTLRKELDISELAAGIYFITLESKSGRETKKFIKE